MIFRKAWLYAISAAWLMGSCQTSGQKINNNFSRVNIAGAMRHVMQRGELSGTINLDTISYKDHLYGLGPVEYLRGEILVADGKSFVSRVEVNGSMIVEETYKVRAPFFVYQNVNQWEEVALPDSIQSLRQLESFLEQGAAFMGPFAFRLTGTVDYGKVHVVNLPPGTEVHSPEDSHLGKVSYSLKNEVVEIIGFFSRKHQGIFTHHDSYVHVHLITDNRQKMGHLDELEIRKGTIRLYLPSQVMNMQ